MRLNILDTMPEEIDALTARDPNATFYHTRPWSTCIDRHFHRLSGRWILAEDGDGVAGVLPYFEVRRGPVVSLWSMPFGTYGGPIVRSGRGGVASELLHAYRDLIERRDVIEVGWVDFAPGERSRGWKVQSARTHVADMKDGFEAFWDDRVDRQRRKRARQADRAGVTVRRSVSSEDLCRYHEIYRARLDRWGRRDAYPYELFESLLLVGGESVRLYVAEHDGAIVGGHFNFYFRDKVICWNGVTTIDSNAVQAATALYASGMEEACAEGFRWYNLGASLGKETLVEFKASLGAVARDYRVCRVRSIAGNIFHAIRGAR